MSESFRPVDAEEMPLPMGVVESTGQLLPPLDRHALTRIGPTDEEVLHRGSEPGADVLAISDVDPNNLSEAGWGIVFSASADPAVRRALEPLIEHRLRQVRDKRLFRVFDSSGGFHPKDTAHSWLARSGVSLSAVDPRHGVPLYLTLVGSPQEMPFEFQSSVDTYWSVGRLSFDAADDYRAYAESVVAYETATSLPHRRRVAVFAPRNPGDRATGLLHDQVAVPLATGSGSLKPLGQRQGFSLHALHGQDATWENLEHLFRGRALGGVPAVLFSASHGLAANLGELDQRGRQGAIVCQDWTGGPIKPGQYFAAADVPSDANVHGLIHLLFACYGGGGSEVDLYSGPEGKLRRIAKQPFVTRLPQRVLRAGALAVLAHIDRAWSYSFLPGRCAPQVQEFRDLMVRILKGDRIGQAADQLNLRGAVLSTELMEAQRDRTSSPGMVSDAMLAHLWVARNEARNHILFGDPAVRLRVESMTT